MSSPTRAGASGGPENNTAGKDYSFVRIDAVKTKENVRACARCLNGAVTGGRGFLRHLSSRNGLVTDLLTWDVGVTVTSLAVVGEKDVWAGLARGDILIYDLGARDTRKRPFFGHKDGVTCMQAFPSPPEEACSAAAVISGGSDFVVKLWSSEGEHLGSISGHANHIHCVATKAITDSSLLILSGSAHGAVLATLLERQQASSAATGGSSSGSSGSSYTPKTRALALPASSKAVTSLLEHQGRLWVGYDHGMLRICDTGWDTITGETNNSNEAMHATSTMNTVKNVTGESLGLGSIIDGHGFSVAMEMPAAHAGRVSAMQGIGNAVWTGSADHRVVAWDAHRLGVCLFELGDQGAFISCMQPVDWMMWVFTKDRALFYTSRSLFDNMKMRERTLLREQTELRRSLRKAEDACEEQRALSKLEGEEMLGRIDSGATALKQMEMEVERVRLEREEDLKMSERRMDEMQADTSERQLETSSEFQRFLEETLEGHESMKRWANEMEVELQEAISAGRDALTSATEELKSCRDELVKAKAELAQVKLAHQSRVSTLEEKLANTSRELEDVTNAAASTQSESAASLTKRDERIDGLEVSLREANAEMAKLAEKLASERGALQLSTDEKAAQSRELTELRLGMEEKSRELDATRAEAEGLRRDMEDAANSGSAEASRLRAALQASQEERQKQSEALVALRNENDDLRASGAAGDEVARLMKEDVAKRDEELRTLRAERDGLAESGQALKARAEALEKQVESERSEKRNIFERERSVSVAMQSTEEREKKLIDEKQGLEREASEMAGRHREAEEALVGCRAELEAERQKVAGLEDQLNELREGNDAIQGQSAANERAVESMRTELDGMRSAVAEKEKEFRERSEEQARQHASTIEELQQRLRAEAEESQRLAADEHRLALDEMTRRHATEAEKAKAGHERLQESNAESLRTLREELDAQNARASSLQSELDASSAKVSELAAAAEDGSQRQREDAARLNAVVAERDAHAERLASLEDVKDSLMASLDANSKELLDLKGRLASAELEGERAGLERESLLTSLSARNKEVQDIRAELEGARESARQQAEELQRARKDREGISGELSELSDKMAALDSEKTRATDALRTMEEDVRRLQRQLEQETASATSRANEASALDEKLRASTAENGGLRVSLERLERDAQAASLELQSSRIKLEDAQGRLHSLELRHREELGVLRKSHEMSLDAASQLHQQELGSLSQQREQLVQERETCERQLQDCQRELNKVLGERYKLSQRLKRCLKEMNSANNARQRAAADELVALQAKYKQSRHDYRLAMEEGATRDTKLESVTRENELLAQQLASTTKSLHFFRHQGSVRDAEMAEMDAQLQGGARRCMQLKSLLQQSVNDIRAKNERIEQLNQALEQLREKMKRSQTTERKVLAQMKDMNENLIARQQQSQEQMTDEIKRQQMEMTQSLGAQITLRQREQEEEKRTLLGEQRRRATDFTQVPGDRPASSATRDASGQNAGGQFMSFDEIMADAAKRPRSAVADSYVGRRRDDRYK